MENGVKYEISGVEPQNLAKHQFSNIHSDLSRVLYRVGFNIIEYYNENINY
jgi:virulence-associated protein VapD